MRFRGLVGLAATVLMLGMVFYPQASAQDTAPPDADEATAIQMHFNGDGLTTVDPAAGNSTEQSKPCPGRPYGGRRYGTVIGEWGFVPAATFKVQGSFKADIWAKSDAGAKNAGFRLNFYVGSTLIDGLFSDRTDLSTAHKFTISGSMSATCTAGVTVKAGLVWLSDPTYGVGPSGAGTFLYGSKDHDSNVVMTLTAAPVTMNVTSVDKEGGNLKINARVNESLGMPIEALTYSVSIQGPATVTADSIAKPTISAGDNGTSVSWLWNYKKSKARSGLYTFTIIVAYCNDTSFSNATQVLIKGLETQTVAPSLFGAGGGGGGNMLLILVVVIVVAVVAGLVVFIVWRRKKHPKKSKQIAAAEAEAAAA